MSSLRFVEEALQVDAHGDALRQAQHAYAEGDWPAAAEWFDSVADEQINADGLAAYFEAVWWLGRTDDALRLAAAAYAALVDDSRQDEAIRTALWLGAWHIVRGDEPQGFGWFGRAARLAEDIPESPAHGYLLLFTEIQANMMAGEPAKALATARRVHDLGRRFDDPNLVAAALHGEGRALLKLGQVVDGLALIDEAMVDVLQGRITPFFTGNLYCFTLEACHEVADWRRLARWTDVTEQWLASQSAAVVLDAMCRVHRAQLQLLRGDWDGAEQGAREVIDLLEVNRVDYAAEAWYLIGEVRRLRGNAGAADAYVEAHARGRDPQPGRALWRLQKGDATGAATSIRSALTAAGPDPLRRAPICAAAVEIALTTARLEEAREVESELTATAAKYGTSGLEAMAATARGTLLVADGRAEEALPLLRDACRRWVDLGAVYEAAGTCRWLAKAYRALGDGASATAEEARAKETYQRLGAVQLDPEPPNGLTGREREVLALVSEGRSNREIGEELFISDRTVARHLTNIFHKIEVSNRTEAARFAVQHGIATFR
jgi:DNA-binding NarL/FixJ family response regulator